MKKYGNMVLLLILILVLALSGCGGSSSSTKSSPKPSTKTSTTPVIAAGYYHNRVLTSNGTVYAWGFNEFGQLGNGSNDDSNTPLKVSGL